jgi:AraC-like DNA-binding protein
MGSVVVYVAVEGDISVSIEGGEWQAGQLAVVHPYIQHQVQSQARLINVILLEAETVDLAMLPEQLLRSGIFDAPAFVDRIRARRLELCAKGDDFDLVSLDFDKMLFGKTLTTRSIDSRILAVMETIKRHPSTPASAEECAEMAHLSVSRFLHLFTQEVGVACAKSVALCKKRLEPCLHRSRDRLCRLHAPESFHPADLWPQAKGHPCRLAPFGRPCPCLAFAAQRIATACALFSVRKPRRLLRPLRKPSTKTNRWCLWRWARFSHPRACRRPP